MTDQPGRHERMPQKRPTYPHVLDYLRILTKRRWMLEQNTLPRGA